MSLVDEYEVFYRWLENNGCQRHPEIRIDKKERRGLFVTNDIPIYTALVSVPLSLIINANRLETNCEDTDEHVRLTIFILNEYSKNETSFWYSWLKLLNIDEEKKDFLTGQMQIYDCVEHSTLAQALTARYQQLQEQFSQNSNDDQIDFDLYCTVDHLIWSRVIQLPDSIGVSLVPMIDFANHSHDPNARWFVNDEKTHVILRSERSLNSNEEVTISYGDKSNEELLYLYGFTLENNSNDRVTLPVSLSPDDPSIDEKLRLVQENQLPPRLVLNQQGCLTEPSKLLANILSDSPTFLIELYRQYENDLNRCQSQFSNPSEHYIAGQKQIIRRAIEQLE